MTSKAATRRSAAESPSSSSDPAPSFVHSCKSYTRPTSLCTHCRFVSRRTRLSSHIYRDRLDERRLSVPAAPTRRLRRSSIPRPTSFLDMREPSRFSMAGPKFLAASTMDTIKRKVSLELDIPDALSSHETHNWSHPRSHAVGRTLNTLLRPKRKSQEAPLPSPGLSSGDSTHSESSLPPTPRSGVHVIAPDSFLDLDPEEEKKKEVERREYQERREMLLDLSQFINRRLTLPHHRFPKEEVPYMQAYSSVALHNDYYTYELQHFLAPFGSPTFHDFGDSPPRDVLDLGCGEGYWAAEAAIVWKAAGTVVTAFDIVDLGRPLRKALDPETQQRLIWVKGNFLKQGLPFPAKSFDLVRMANLTLAIPQDRWSHVLKEVKRVLRPGGIVEIVDDEVFFPSIQPAPSASHERTHSPDGGAARVAHPQDGAPTASPRRQSKAVNPTASGSRLSIPADVSDHRQRSIATRTMETVFQNMLLYEYNVSPTPHQFLEDEILKAFDGVTVKTKEVVIPKKDLGFRTVSDDGPSTPSASDMTTKGRKGRHSLDNNVTDFSPPAFVAPKAAQLLQLEAGNRGRYQPPGFIVLPDSFMPCDPDALEMHACHNIHLLLGCKDALGRYIEQQRSEDGEPLVSDEEFEELLFDYENFRRQRMNWPQNYPGVNLEEEPASPQRPMFSRKDLSIRNRPPSGLGMSMNVSVPKDAVIPVRRIRAFAGRKSDPKAAHVR